MKVRLFILFILISLSNVVSGNAAQPGYWASSGYRHFQLLFPEDSNAFGKVQMKEEFVAIQIYNGFAVVRGTYTMQNLSNKPLLFRAGYPLRTEKRPQVRGSLALIELDSLYALSVRVNGIARPIVRYNDSSYSTQYPQQWYVWNCEFTPGGTLVFEVFFIVEIKMNGLRQGYSHHDTYPFIYITESGSTWQNPIGKADIVVQLMDGLKWEQIEGVWPNSRVKGNGKDMLYYHFENRIPSDTDNLVLAFQLKIPNYFRFSSVISLKEKLHEEIKKLNPSSIQGQTWKETHFPDAMRLEDKATFFTYILWALPLVIAAAVIGLIIWVITKLVKRLNSSPK
jgi:hypothetical protein